jgi:hypothetical protein
MEWILANKWWLQYVLLAALILATVLQFFLSQADNYQAQKERQEIQTTLNSVKDHLKELSKVEGLERFLNDIKIESLRKYVNKKDFEELQKYLKDFSENLRLKNIEGLKQSVKNVLQIIPTEPYFRVYNLILNQKTNFGIEKLFSGEWRIVQVIKWDWIVEGNEKAEVYVNTMDDGGNKITLGPFTNNVISMLEQPINQFVQIRFQSSGTGRFEMIPRSFRIGWAVASKDENGKWKPNPGFAEFDPFFRLNIHGELEY